MNLEPHKSQLLKTIKSQDIEQFKELYGPLKSQFGTDHIENLMVEILNELTSDPPALSWFIDNSQASPTLNLDGELTGFTIAL